MSKKTLSGQKGKSSKPPRLSLEQRETDAGKVLARKDTREFLLSEYRRILPECAGVLAILLDEEGILTFGGQKLANGIFCSTEEILKSDKVISKSVSSLKRFAINNLGPLMMCSTLHQIIMMSSEGIKVGKSIETIKAEVKIFIDVTNSDAEKRSESFIKGSLDDKEIADFRASCAVKFSQAVYSLAVVFRILKDNQIEDFKKISSMDTSKFEALTEPPSSN